MKTEILYRTETHVSKVRVKHDNKDRNVIITGRVERLSRRKLWFIPLPDRYRRRMSTMLIAASGEIMIDAPWADYTFDSQKRIAAKQREVENVLKLKCREYGKRRA